MEHPVDDAHVQDGGTQRTYRLDSLTGLRFVAALMVFWWHLWESSNPAGIKPFTGSSRWFSPGATGVTFFFILSGFVLTWSHQHGDTPGDFYRRRFARIYPAYALVVVAVTFLEWFVHNHNPDGKAVVAALLLVQAWIPKASYYFGVEAVLWTLSVEAFFYAVFPFIRRPLANLSSGARKASIAVLIAATFALAAACSPATSGTTRFWLLSIFPPTRLLEFAIGILLALEIRARTLPRVPLVLGAAAVLVGYVIAATLHSDVRDVAVMVLPFALLIVAAAQADLEGRGSLFSAPWFVLLGAWSYAFYLVHVRVLVESKWLAHRLHFDLSGRPPAFGIVFALVMAGGGVVLAALLFTYWERPCEERLRPRRTSRVSAGPSGIS